MFKNNRQANNINAYVNLIKKVVKDDEIKEEILEQLETFTNDGYIAVDGNNLSGKILNSDGNLYIDIKYENGKFICLYTKWNLDSIVTIEQESLKGGNYKLSKIDKVKYDTYNNENKIESEITEKIYNIENKLLYESKTKTEESFNSYKEQLLYRDDSPFINVVDIEKTWYMPNESIIRYSMNKNELHSKEEIQEAFLICEKPYVNEFSTTRNFINLGRNLFVELMTGKITIEEVLETLKENSSVKKKGDKK